MAYCALLLVLLAGGTQAADFGGALQADDECSKDTAGDKCALEALQRRGLKAADGFKTSESGWGSCRQFGCSHHYRRWQGCQCNSACRRYGNCCSDFAAKCEAHPAAPPAPPKPMMPPAPPVPMGDYDLKWVAQGTSFFDEFTFATKDENHGSAEYLPRSDAEAAGVIEAEGSFAVLRAGAASPRYLYKRETAKILSKQSWKHFLVAMRYSHVPYGCGVWPAFFTLAPDAAWPDGGEIDLLEYVNSDVSKSSFHTGGSCKLNPAAVSKYGSMPDRNSMNYDCVTQYPDRLGCAPNKWMKTGQEWARSPGVVAAEWTESFLKIFYIPEHELPTDLLSDEPKPDTWDRWLFSYYPFEGTGCTMQAQQLVMQIGFCGDWASKVWDQDGQCKHKINGCRAVDPLHEYAPQQDCCTKFIWDEDKAHGTDSYLQSQAFFNMSWMKVFQQR